MINTPTIDLIVLNLARAQQVLNVVEEDVDKLALELQKRDEGKEPVSRQQYEADMKALDAAVEKLRETFKGMEVNHYTFNSSL